MKNAGGFKLASLMRILLDILFIANILALAALPWIVRMLYDQPDFFGQLKVDFLYDISKSTYPFYLGFAYAAGIGTAWILLEGHFILRRLGKGEPFAKGQAGSFRRVGAAFGLLTAAFAVKMLTCNTLLTMFCCGLFALFVLIALILSEVFRQAYLVKTDNDLTI
jgi:hypothetical protein